MGFLWPYFLGGAALVAVPFIIHHIRRPERQVVRFSSLMFVPQIKKEVVERRRLQHILLMLLRMLIFGLLALAFARPYRVVQSNRAAAATAQAYHVVLLDVSLSMQAGETFAAAKTRARALIDDLPLDARVGLVVFDTTPRTVVDLMAGTAEDTHAKTLAALEAAQPGGNGTDYLNALRTTENLLPIEAQDAAAEPNCYLHMISDFRKNGMPQTLPAWRLSGRINFVGYRVGEDHFANAAVSDAVVRLDETGRPSVVARVKNYGTKTETLPVTLTLADGTTHAESVTVGPGGAGIATFVLPEHQGRIEGRLTTPADGFEGDDTFFLLWRPDPGKRIWLVGDAESRDAYGALWFLEKALAASQERTWQMTGLDAAQVTTRLAQEAPPDAMILGDAKSWDAATTAALKTFTANGGSLLVCAGAESETSGQNALLAAFGATARGTRFARTQESTYESVAWVDFEHPALYAFRAARFNDFSSVRFHNYRQVDLPEGASVLARVGRADGGMAPVMAELPVSGGRVMLWAFSPNLAWTNLPKHVKLVPLLGETMDYLTRRGGRRDAYQVGESFPLTTLTQPMPWTVRDPAGRETHVTTREGLGGLFLDRPGFVSLQSDGETWSTIAGVNTHSDEGNPEGIAPAELALKLTSNSRVDGEKSQRTVFDGTVRRRDEWGYWPAAVILPLVLLEGLIAVRLSRRRRKEAA